MAVDKFFERVSHILRTLPIGYYLGKNISVKLSEYAETSYYAMTSNRIVISYPLIVGSCKNFINDNDKVESLIRHNVYHELLHVLRTPKDIFDNLNSVLRQVFYRGSNKLYEGSMTVEDAVNALNIFEDERNERFGETEFANTYFSKTFPIIAGWPYVVEEGTADEFFVAVRFRVGKPQWLQRVEEIFSKYYWMDTHPTDDELLSYQKEVIKLYADIVNNIDIPTPPEPEPEFDPKSLKELAEALIEENQKEYNYDGSAYYHPIEKMIKEFDHKIQLGNDSVAAYSGKIDSHNIARPNNACRYWNRQNNSSLLGKKTKLHLNMWLDCSRSYVCNEDETNNLLKALYDIENKYSSIFSMDIMKMSKYCEMADESDPWICAEGNNRLNNSYTKCLETTRYKDRDVFDIVLFDGPAGPYFNQYHGSTLVGYRMADDQIGYWKKLWNNRHTIIITDQSNELLGLTKEVPLARVIVSNNYIAELKENILTVFRRFIHD